MRNLILFVICLTVFNISCRNIPDKRIPELIKNDWVLINARYNDTYLLVQDSLIIENLTQGDIPISPYIISNDTLIIYSQDFNYNINSPSIKRTLKLKILKIDSLELLVSPAYTDYKDTMFFKKIDLTKRNDLKIEKLEFSYTGGYGFSKDLKIDHDSTLIHYGYSHFSKIKGLSKCKLDSEVFERIQRLVYAIDRDSFALRYPGPVTSNFYLFINTQNDSIEIEGVPDSNTDSKLKYVFSYLMWLEYLVNLDSVQNENINFKYKTNSNWFKTNN